MLDHMTFRVRDIERSRAFYAAALSPLGYVQAYDAEHDGVRVIGFACGEAIDTWLVGGGVPTTGCHLAWRAPSRAAVRAFHAAALGQGGQDNGAPGLRPHYDPDYYGAFVIDPDGNNVEAVCRLPE